MKKSLLLTGSVMVFLTSCYSYKEISLQPDFNRYKNDKNTRVISVITGSDSIYFSDKIPGKMTDNSISGIYQVPLVRFVPDSVLYKSTKYKHIVEHVYKDGLRYDAIEQKDGVYIYNSTMAVNIPYTDTKTVKLKIFYPGRSAALIGGSSAGLVGLFIIIFSNMSFNGGGII